MKYAFLILATITLMGCAIGNQCVNDGVCTSGEQALSCNDCKPEPDVCTITPPFSCGKVSSTAQTTTLSLQNNAGITLTGVHITMYCGDKTASGTYVTDGKSIPVVFDPTDNVVTFHYEKAYPGRSAVEVALTADSPGVLLGNLVIDGRTWPVRLDLTLNVLTVRDPSGSSTDVVLVGGPVVSSNGAATVGNGQYFGDSFACPCQDQCSGTFDVAYSEGESTYTAKGSFKSTPR